MIINDSPYAYLANILELYDTIKFMGMSDDAIKLSLLWFSLFNQARIWLDNYAPNTFSTWEQLSHAFLYFPQAKTTMLRIEIMSFRQ